jgi:hypothetical protein
LINHQHQFGLTAANPPQKLFTNASACFPLLSRSLSTAEYQSSIKKEKCKKESLGHKKWQVTYIAPLNHLPLLSSDPGGVQQELAV